MVANIRIKLKSILLTVLNLNFTIDHRHWFDTNQGFMTITIQYCDPKSLKLINRVIETFGVVDKTSESIQKEGVIDFMLWFFSMAFSKKYQLC